MAEKLLNENRRNIYERSLVQIPTPKFAVFYNGDEEQPEVREMKLSDAFTKKTDEPELELKCKVYNINKGKNAELLSRCQVLDEYMIFVDCVRDFYSESGYNNLNEAISRAIDYCIEHNVLKDFLCANRSEVMKVMQMDFTFERQIELEREEGQVNLQNVFMRIVDGATDEALFADGYTADEVSRAKEIIRIVKGQ